MTLPFHLPLRPDFPHELVVPMSDVGAFVAMVTVLVGFAYLLFGVQVFRLVTTVQSILIGTLGGALLGTLIDSRPLGMLLVSIAAGLAMWFYTRWTMALIIGLMAAGYGWIVATALEANAIGAFFVAVGAAVMVGAPVLLFYRTVVMLYTSFAGGAMVVSGTAAAIVLIRYRTMPSMQHGSGHFYVGLICTLLLAVPAFFFQRLRYPVKTEDKAGEHELIVPDAPRRKAA